MQSLKGNLLVASARLLDPNFAQTVILMVQHDENGALGLVLNRPLNATVKEACEDALETSCEVDAHLYQGGPCEGPLMVLHDEQSTSQIEVCPGVRFTTERDQIEQLLTRNYSPARFFIGYSGWGAGQLEGEIATGSWLMAPASAQTVFSDGAQTWQKLMKQITLGQWIDPSRIPEDPTVN